MFCVPFVTFFLPILCYLTLGDGWTVQESKCDRYTDIAIIGAGPGGTYAAYRLREANLKVDLFEYSDRIGGRLYTTTLPGAPDVNVELGGMIFYTGIHQTFSRLVEELNVPLGTFGNSSTFRFYLNGKSLTLKDIARGNVPYDMCPEEKANGHRLMHYYLEKLTGYTGRYLTRDMLMKLKVADGRELYKLTFDEALDLVATPGGKEFVKYLIAFESFSFGDVSILQAFTSEIASRDRGEVYTPQLGMNALPKSLAKAFVEASSKNSITLNMMLTSIVKTEDGNYRLEFIHTATESKGTKVLGSKEYVCAKKVILALPQAALTRIDWEPLREKKVWEALHAVKSVPLCKVFMTFDKAWWLTDAKNPANDLLSDLFFQQTYEFPRSNVSGNYVLLASYADGHSLILQQRINSKGQQRPESVSGEGTVTDGLKEAILSELSKAYGIPRDKIPKPKAAIWHVWDSYPYAGGVTVWRPGYHMEDVGNIIRRPSVNDEVFIVGSDHAVGDLTGWTEGALTTVNELMDAYFS